MYVFVCVCVFGGREDEGFVGWGWGCVWVCVVIGGVVVIYSLHYMNFFIVPSKQTAISREAHSI